MAKIGNEAKLILKLAAERAEVQRIKYAFRAEELHGINEPSIATAKKEAYRHATEAYNVILINITLELEIK